MSPPVALVQDRLPPSPQALLPWRLGRDRWLNRLPRIRQLGRRYQANARIGQPGRVIPIAHSQDTVGPFGRTVSDAAALLGVLAGADPEMWRL